jgi:hypothetical protein
MLRDLKHKNLFPVLFCSLVLLFISLVKLIKKFYLFSKSYSRFIFVGIIDDDMNIKGKLKKIARRKRLIRTQIQHSFQTLLSI